MSSQLWTANVPMLGILAITTLIVLLSIDLGYRWGRKSQSRSELEREKEAPVGAMVAAALGLLALLLAFAFGMAEDAFQARREALEREASAIRNAYLRAEFLEESQRADVRRILRAYVDERLQGSDTGSTGISPASRQLLDQLWAQTVAAGAKHPDVVIIDSFVNSVSEVIKLNTERRVLRERNRIPPAFGVIVLIIAIVTFAAMGYHAAVAGTVRSPAMVAVALAFSLVIMLIADLNRPGGYITISLEPMIELRDAIVGPKR